MKPNKITVYFNKTFFISGMIWSLCCISPWIVFLYLQTDGFREVILDEGFFVLAVFLLLAISLPIILLCAYRLNAAVHKMQRQFLPGARRSDRRFFGD